MPYKKPCTRKSTDREKNTRRYCRYHDVYGHDINECHQLRDVIEKLICEKRLEQYVHEPFPIEANPKPSALAPKAAAKAAPGPSNPRRGIVINTICGGPYPTNDNFWKMEEYVSSIKHATYETFSAPDESVPAKLQKTRQDDIVHRKRDSMGTEISTIDPLVITI